jgi:hypothetical protein
MSASENEPWVILTARYGGDTSSPTAEQLAHAMAEVYHENIPSMAEDDYAEHPNAWLRYGFDDGPLYVIDVYRTGTVRFSQWADPDYENELEAESGMANVTEQHSLRLWTLLAQGQIDQIKKEKWNAI